VVSVAAGMLPLSPVTPGPPEIDLVVAAQERVAADDEMGVGVQRGTYGGRGHLFAQADGVAIEEDTQLGRTGGGIAGAEIEEGLDRASGPSGHSGGRNSKPSAGLGGKGRGFFLEGAAEKITRCRRLRKVPEWVSVAVLLTVMAALALSPPVHRALPSRRRPGCRCRSLKCSSSSRSARAG